MPTSFRDQLKLLARHTDLQPEEMGHTLREAVYADRTQWAWLLKWLFLALGCGLIASGILFFFAYNWDAIPKFGKLGLAALGVAVPGLLALYPGISTPLRKVLLTSAAFLVGPLLGVFGQVYQTGADSYELFRSWLLLIVVWALVIDFAPLWLLFVTLLNVTVVTYLTQTAPLIDDFDFFKIAAGLNVVTALIFHFVGRFVRKQPYPYWFITLLAAVATYALTNWVVIAVVDRTGLWITGVWALLAALTAWYGYRNRSLGYLGLVALSVVAVVSALILRADLNDGGSFLLTTLWVLSATSVVTLQLNNLRKAWRYEAE